MPISSDRFMELFDRANELHGWRVQVSRVGLFYAELCHLHPDDIEAALRDMGYQDRFSFHAFRDSCYKYAGNREEREKQNELASDKKHAEEFFEQMTDGDCMYRSPKCSLCPRKYCGHVAAFAKLLFTKIRHGMVSDIEAEWRKFYRGEYEHYLKHEDVQVPLEADAGEADDMSGVSGDGEDEGMPEGQEDYQGEEGLPPSA